MGNINQVSLPWFWLIAGQYNDIDSPDDTRLWQIPVPDDDAPRAGAPKLQRRAPRTNPKIKREDMINVLSQRGYVDHFEDESIPGKAIVLKMPERKMKTYFIPLPVDLDVSPSNVYNVRDSSGEQ